MVISGLNNLALTPQPFTEKGAETSKGASTSFAEQVRQKLADPQKAQAKPRRTLSNETSQKKTSAQSSNMTVPGQDQLEQKNVQPENFSEVGSPRLDHTLKADISADVSQKSLAVSEGLATASSGEVKTQSEPNELTRRVVWNDFLRKMKDDFGISAEDILNALTSLSDEELTKPPQENLDKVVLALGLSEQQAVIARQYLQDLVQKTKTQSLGDELNVSKKQISLAVLSEREIAQKNMDRALDSMNRDFFNAKQMLAKPGLPIDKQTVDENNLTNASRLSPGSENLPLGQLRQERAAFANSPELMKAFKTDPSNQPVDVNEVLRSFSKNEDRLQSNNQAAAATQVGSENQSRVGTQKEAVSANSSQAFLFEQAVGLQNANLSAPAKAQESGLTSKLGLTQTAADNQSGILSVNGSSPNLFSQSKANDEEDDFSEAEEALLSQINSELQSLKNSDEFKSALADLKPSASPVAIPELLEKAQVLVKDGGGEMRLILSPEGLGEVKMKVSVEQGQVQIQMITESDEAKKMIERQMGDLKSQLATNNLTLETLKVDTSANVSQQFDQPNQDAQRQQAQQALEQFRQDHQGWRRSFFEVPSARVYQSQNEAPRDVQAPGYNNKKAQSRRLDLVA